MFKRGYQPTGTYKHMSVELFLEETMGASGLVIAFDRLRKKRHRVAYEGPGIISREEAEYAISKAVDFVAEVEKKIGIG